MQLCAEAIRLYMQHTATHNAVHTCCGRQLSMTRAGHHSRLEAQQQASMPLLHDCMQQQKQLLRRPKPPAIYLPTNQPATKQHPNNRHQIEPITNNQNLQHSAEKALQATAELLTTHRMRCSSYALSLVLHTPQPRQKVVPGGG